MNLDQRLWAAISYGIVAASPVAAIVLVMPSLDTETRMNAVSAAVVVGGILGALFGARGK
jgi:hypothetical protein